MHQRQVVKPIYYIGRTKIPTVKYFCQDGDSTRVVSHNNEFYGKREISSIL